MGELDIGFRVHSRDNLGRFLSHLEEGARRAVEETAKRSAEVARARATVKSGAMRATIQPVMLSATSGGVVVGTDHWRYQNSGTAPHSIPGNVRFFWERAGREWTPGDNNISHPGNPAVHFMDEAADFARAYFPAAVARNI